MGLLYKVLHREAPLRGANPYPFKLYSSLTDFVTPSVCFSLKKGPLSHTFITGPFNE